MFYKLQVIIKMIRSLKANQSNGSKTSKLAHNGGAQDNLVAKKVVSRARDDDDEGIREGQRNTIVNGVAASNKGNVTWIFFFPSFLMQRVML
ncbi:hypothetical protein Dimus_016523 [Dionaea muscipula]